MITRRQTLKLSLPLRRRAWLIGRVTDHLPPHEEAPGVLLNRIDSLYLDSPALDLYSRAVSDPGRRTLLRLRAYNGQPPVFAEMKQNAQGKSFKLRAELSGVSPGLSRSALREAVTRRNPFPSAEYEALLAQAGRLIDLEALTPTLHVRYRRLAFQRPGDAGVRLTIDSHVTMMAVHGGSAATRPAVYRYPNAILEVKLEDERPAWIEQLLADPSLTPLADFCKYAHGISMTMAEAPASA